MYKIIGGDGQEYGPVSAEQLRQWMTEGRVNAQTRARAEGTADWKALTEFPELAATVPPPLALSPPATASVHQLTRFPVAAAILLHYLTCGLFSMIWLNLMHGKMPRVRPDDPSAGRAIGFCFIPFFNFYWIFFTYRRLCLRIAEQRELYGMPPNNLRGVATATAIFQVIPYINLLVGYLIMTPVFMGRVQSSVNQLVDTSATTAPQRTLPTTTVPASGISGWAIAAIVCACIIPVVGILAAMLLPALNSAREKARMANCHSNLRQMGLAIAMYADLYNEYCPTDNSDPHQATALGSLNLLTNVTSSGRIFACPSDHRKTAKASFQTGDGLNDSNLSYNYVGAGLKWQENPDAIIAYDADGNHRSGYSVLFNDGHVEFMTPQRFQQLHQ